MTPATGAVAAAHRLRATLALAIVAVSIAAYAPFAPLRLADFRAFYCAGRAVLSRADPYREHPLHECERAALAPGIPPGVAGVTVPAPLPGYAIALFAVPALLPFGPAAVLWICLSAAAAIGTVRLLAITLEIAPAATAIVVGLPAAIVAIPLGQVTPFVGLGLAAAAYGVRRGAYVLAAGGALLTALDPPVALAVCATLAIGVPALRSSLAAGTALLVAISLAALGPAVNLEYVGAVLHAHAVANVMDRTQFSATHFAWLAGLDRGAAVALGSTWSALALPIGIGVALRLRRRYGEAALVLVPPAFAVFGGLYVHYAQVALALPACLLAAHHAARQPRAKSALCAGVFVLAIPWLALCAFPVFAVAVAVSAMVFCTALDRAGIAVRLSAATSLGLVAFFGIAALTLATSGAVASSIIAGNPLAETSWQNYIVARDARPQLAVVLFQLPTMSAFAACLCALVHAAVARPMEPAS